MTSSDTSARLDELFEKFIFDGFDEEEKKRIQERSKAIDSQLRDAADRLRGIMADREGREALTRALREGLKNG